MKIIVFGSDNFRRTKTYRDQVEKVREEARSKYRELQSNQSWISKWILRVKMNVEVRRKISKIDSENCY